MNLFAEGGLADHPVFSVLFLVIFRRPLGWLLKLWPAPPWVWGFWPCGPRAAWPPVWPWGSMPSTPSPWACWGCQGWGCSFFSGGWVHNARRPRPSPPSRQISPREGDPPCATAPITPLPSRPGSAGFCWFSCVPPGCSPAVFLLLCGLGVLSPPPSQQVSAWLHPPAASTPPRPRGGPLLPEENDPFRGFSFPWTSWPMPPDPGRRL